MFVVIDLILIALFVSLVVLFTKYGLMKTIKKIGKAWLSVFCSAVLGPWVADRISGLFLCEPITNGIHKTLYGLVESNANDYSLGELFANLPSGFVRFLEGLDINFASLEAEYGSATYASEEIVFAISERIAAPCIDMISSLIGHIVCFVVPLIFFAWLNWEIKKHKVPFFRHVDRVVGFFAGMTAGYAAAWAVAVVLRTIFQVVVCFDAHSPVTAIYESTFVMKFLNEFHMIAFIKNAVMTIIEVLPF